MLDYSQIKSMAQEAAERAELEGVKPTSIFDLDLHSRNLFPLPVPFLGDYVPEGWEILPDQQGEQQSLFCDSSGFGSENEPAMSVNQLVRKLEQYAQGDNNIGFGIIEAGEFQVVIGLYRPDSRDFTHTGGFTNAELNTLRHK